MASPLRTEIVSSTMSHLFEEIRKRAKTVDHEPRRLLHGRGATVPGHEFLVIDWYEPVVLITLYQTCERSWLMQLGGELSNILGKELQGIAIQDRSNRNLDSWILSGTVPESLDIVENGLKYRIDPLARQNVGFFPDMKVGRQLVRKQSKDKKVLNLFAYTCAFSVAAIAGGASQVINLDMNRNLLDRGKENHLLNGHDLRNISFLPYNLFKSFGRLKKEGPFDMVIIDPPYQQGSSFQAMRDWPKTLKRLPDLLSDKGEIIAAVSAPKLGRSFLLRQFESCLPSATLLEEITAGGDFPESEPDKGLHIQYYRL